MPDLAAKPTIDVLFEVSDILVHVFQQYSPEIKRHLYFRDYLISHSSDAQKYAELKITLAQVHADNRREYVFGKQAYVKKLEVKAIQMD